MGVHKGEMTKDRLEKYIKGYAEKGAQVIDTNMQAGNMLEGAFPAATSETERASFFVTHGNPGVRSVAMSGTVDQTTWDYKEIYAYLDWDKYAYMISDDAKDWAAVDRMAADGNRNALEFFGASRTYEIITALKAGNDSSCTHGASAYWNADSGNAEGDIMQAIEGIVENSGVNLKTRKIGVVYPSKVLRGLKELDLIHNTTQRLEKYLKEMFAEDFGGIEFFPFTPYMDADGNKYIDTNKTSSDALGTSALVFVEGPQTLKTFKYTATGSGMTETTRIHDRGWITTMRHCYGTKVVPMYDASYLTTPLIYEITAVSA